MTRVRFLSSLFVAVCAAGVVTFAGGANAEPVSKGAGQNNATPDLKAFFDTVGKAVKDEKWPAEADEKLLRGTAQTIFDRTLKAAEEKERKLPVDFSKLTKADVVREYKQASLDGKFLIAG